MTRPGIEPGTSRHGANALTTRLPSWSKRCTVRQNSLRTMQRFVALSHCAAFCRTIALCNVCRTVVGGIATVLDVLYQPPYLKVTLKKNVCFPYKTSPSMNKLYFNILFKNLQSFLKYAITVFQPSQQNSCKYSPYILYVQIV